MDMNPYLSGVCAEWRSRLVAADQLMDHNLAIADHLTALHHPAFLHCAHHRQNANSHRTPLHRIMCTLCSVRHSPQFMGAFHSFVLECFIFSNIWTCAQCLQHCTDFVAAYMVLHPLSPVQLLHCCIGTFPLQCTGVNCSSLWTQPIWRSIW